MAVVQYSALLTQLRGKLGGSQFNKVRTGYSLQGKSTPTIRLSPAQSKQRQIMSAVQRQWALETGVRRNEAAQAAASNPVSDRFGQQVVLSGYNQYIKIMSWRLLTNSSTIPTPLDASIITTPVASMSVEVSNFVLTFGAFQAPGRYVFTATFDRLLVGATTGANNQNRAFYYITPVTADGRRRRGGRRVFLFWGVVQTANGVSATQVLDTLMVFNTGDYVLLEVYARNTGAGADVGYRSYLIQIS